MTGLFDLFPLAHLLDVEEGTVLGSATVFTDSEGRAVFSGLGVQSDAGNYTLRFTSPGLTGVDSNVVTVA